MERDEFFQKASQEILKGVFSLFQDHPLIQKLEQFAEVKVRPPGAVPLEATFRALCTGCDNCMKACPVHAIYIEDLNKRLPLLYPERQPCLHCTAYPCVQSCTTGALSLDNGIDLRSFE